MHLIVLHGVPGVGKRSVATKLAELLDFRFFDAHHLAITLGPLFGFATPAFNELRDAIYASIINRALAERLPGVIATCIFEPSVPLDSFRSYLAAAREGGGQAMFVGLQCDNDALKSRVEDPERAAMKKLNDFAVLRRIMDTGYFDVPELPGPSMLVDTSAMTPAEAAAHILTRLPEAVRRRE